MTRVTPEQAQALREGTTPGPWQFKEDVTDLPNGSQEIGHVVQVENTSLFECWDDVIDLYPGNLALAAAAPELAQTVAEMRCEYEVQARMLDAEAPSMWLPCDSMGLTGYDSVRSGEPWTGPRKWRMLGSAKVCAAIARAYGDRHARIVRRLVTDDEVIE